MTEPGPREIRQVRLLISDVDPARQVLTDDDVLDFLTIENGSVKLAAAGALDAIASSEVLVGKVIRTQDLSTDGSKVAEQLRAHAAALREQVAIANADGDDGSQFTVVAAEGHPHLMVWGRHHEWWL